MSSNECLNDYYSFSLSLIDFLEKNLSQLEKSMFEYSLKLKTFQRKSKKIVSKTNSLSENLQQAFRSFVQTIEDEFYQLDQRRKFVHLIEINLKKVHQQIHSSEIRKEKRLVEKYKSRSSSSVRQYEEMSSIWKDHLDILGSQTVNLLWRLFSYSPVKTILPSMKIGSGDEYIPTSNNACIQSSSQSTEIDETMIEQNEHIDDDDDEDEQWLKLVKQNAQQLDQRSLHLSDLSLTTECSAISLINTGRFYSKGFSSKIQMK